MKKTNIFFLILIFLYFGFFFYRLLISRIPRDPLVMTGIITGIIVLIFSVKFFLQTFVILYKKVTNPEENKKNQNSILGKVLVFFKKKEKEVDFFFSKFYQDFLWKNHTFSRISVFFCAFYVKTRPFANFYIALILLIPWITFLIIFFFEIIFLDFCYISLYLLTANFLIQKLLDVIIFSLIAEFKFKLNNLLHNKFFLINYSNEIPIKEFFLVNRNFQCQFFFYNKSFQNKKLLGYFWQVFNELLFVNASYRILTDFVKPYKVCLLKFLRKVNAIVYINAFLSYLIFYSEDFFQINLPEIYFVLLFSLSSFLIFLRWLDFLNGCEEDLPYKNYFSDSTEIFLYFYEDFLESIRRELLQKFSFLCEEDLKYYFFDRENMHISRFAPFIDPLTEEENDLIADFQEKLLENFRNHLLLGNVVMSAFSLKRELQKGLKENHDPKVS